jgi:mono/diheme cytochrome c family protein
MKKLSLIFFLFLFPTFGHTQNIELSYLETIEKGKFLAENAGCLHCHGKKGQAPLGGGYEINSPVGVFVTPNISMSDEFGIGTWTDEQFINAVKKGISPTGKNYFPAFPYTSFSKLSDNDIRYIKRFLETFEPVEKTSVNHRFDNYIYNNRLMVGAWKRTYFTNGFRNPIKDFYLGDTPFEVSSKKYIEHNDSLNSLNENDQSLWKRGAFLAEAVFHCTQCHTPRASDPVLGKVLGAPKVNYWLGGYLGTPNITPSRKYGIGSWSDFDYQNYFKTGKNPSGRFSTSGGMDHIVNMTKALPDKDLESLIFYLKKLKPVESLDREEF